jgi:hypothetical protein
MKTKDLTREIWGSQTGLLEVLYLLDYENILSADCQRRTAIYMIKLFQIISMKLADNGRVFRLHACHDISVRSTHLLIFAVIRYPPPSVHFGLNFIEIRRGIIQNTTTRSVPVLRQGPRSWLRKYTIDICCNVNPWPAAHFEDFCNRSMHILVITSSLISVMKATRNTEPCNWVNDVYHSILDINLSTWDEGNIWFVLMRNKTLENIFENNLFIHSFSFFWIYLMFSFWFMESYKIFSFFFFFLFVHVRTLVFPGAGMSI